MLRRTVVALSLAVAALAAMAVPAAGAPPWPGTIDLPEGYRPEGIANAGGTRAYVGSIPTGSVSLVDVRTGQVTTLVPGRAGRAAIGLEEAGGLLFVAGGPTGNAYVYDARTGADVAVITLSTDTGNRFINDVVVSHGAAWFTDSRSLTLWRVDIRTLEATPLRLSGISLTAGNNLNGIEAGPGGQVLYAVQSSTGTLFAIDPSTGAATAVASGLANGDGLLRDGQQLYVVQNRLNQIAVLDLRTFERLGTLSSPDFDVPTTVARIGDRLYLPNAKFRSAPTPPPADFEVVSLDR